MAMTTVQPGDAPANPITHAPKAPRVPAGPNSLAAAYNRRAMIGCALLAPIAAAACVTEPAQSAWTSDLAAQWEIDRQTLHAIDVFPDHRDDADAHLWEQVNDAETAILTQEATSIGDVIAKLNVALIHSDIGDWGESALIANDHSALFARADKLDMVPRLIVGAIYGLTQLREA